MVVNGVYFLRVLAVWLCVWPRAIIAPDSEQHLIWRSSLAKHIQAKCTNTNTVLKIVHLKFCACFNRCKRCVHVFTDLAINKKKHFFLIGKTLSKDINNSYKFLHKQTNRPLNNLFYTDLFCKLL